MPPYETRIVDPSEYDDTELGSEVRAAWAEGVRVIELVEPRTLVRSVIDDGQVKVAEAQRLLAEANATEAEDPELNWRPWRIVRGGPAHPM